MAFQSPLILMTCHWICFILSRFLLDCRTYNCSGSTFPRVWQFSNNYLDSYNNNSLFFFCWEGWWSFNELSIKIKKRIKYQRVGKNPGANTMILKYNSGFPFYPKFYFLGIRNYCDSSLHTWLKRENTWDCILVTDCRTCSFHLTEQSHRGMNNPFSSSFCQNLQHVVYCVGTNNKMANRNLKSERRRNIYRERERTVTAGMSNFSIL